MNNENSIEDSYGYKKEHDEQLTIETNKAKQVLEQMTREAVTISQT